MYHGRPIDPLMGKKVSEKGLTMRVVSDLTAPFEGLNHVVYCDNYFTSGPLVEMLAKKKIFLAGSIQKRAAGFPLSLKASKPPKDSYVSAREAGTNYYVFHDCKEVCFVTNVFPSKWTAK